MAIPAPPTHQHQGQCPWTPGALPSGSPVMFLLGLLVLPVDAHGTTQPPSVLALFSGLERSFLNRVSLSSSAMALRRGQPLALAPSGALWGKRWWMRGNLRVLSQGRARLRMISGGRWGDSAGCCVLVRLVRRVCEACTTGGAPLVRCWARALSLAQTALVVGAREGPSWGGSLLGLIDVHQT